LFGLIVPPLSGSVAAYVIGPLWGLAVLLYGLRVVRLSVVASPESLIVRNRFRSYRVAWADIVSIDYIERRVPVAMRMSFMSDRWAGRIRCRAGADPWLDATETFKAFPYGRTFSQHPETGRAGTEAVADEWRSRTGRT